MEYFKEKYPELTENMTFRGSRVSMDVDFLAGIFDGFEDALGILKDEMDNLRAELKKAEEYVELEKRKTDIMAITALTNLVEANNVANTSSTDTIIDGDNKFVRVLSEKGEKEVFDKIREILKRI